VRSLIRRSLSHVNLVATLFLLLMGTSFAIAQESGAPSGQQAEETAGSPDDGGKDDSDQDSSGDDTSDGSGDRNGSDEGDSDQGDAEDGDGSDGTDSDQGEAQSGALSVTVREGDEVKIVRDTLEAQATGQPMARCEDGEVLTGGGVRSVRITSGANPIVQASHPTPDDPSQWQATVLNSTGNGSLTVVAYAVCASGVQSP
jgi:hypothetical protein